jgi:ADP-heptose:LPS heptosyltransferase
VSSANRPPRMLVVKLADLGDLLLCEPALRSLRGAFPTARIDLLVPPTSAALVPLLGHDLRVIPFPKQLFDSPRGLLWPRNVALLARLTTRLRRARYQRVVLLHHLTTQFGARKFQALARVCGAPVVAGLDTGRGSFLTHPVDDLGFGVRHEADYMLAVARAAGGAAVDAAPRVVLGSTPAFDLPQRYVAVYPATGGYASARTWSVDNYVALVETLAAEDMPVVLLGGADATPAAYAILRAVPDTRDLTGQTSLTQLTAIVAGAEAVVGGDSFIGHLAAALQRPQVAIFGPSNADAWRPYGARDAGHAAADRAVVVRLDLPCAPCLYTGFALGRPGGCPTRTCLSTLPVELVYAAARFVRQGA